MAWFAALEAYLRAAVLIVQPAEADLALAAVNLYAIFSVVPLFIALVADLI